MIDLTEVLLNEGKAVQYETMLESDTLRYRSGEFKIAGKTPVFLSVENPGEKKLTLRGGTRLDIFIPCARCLEPVKVRLEINLDSEIDLEGNDYMAGYNLNVDQLVHDEALLVWPERVLCREDCRGLCSVCGRNLNEGPCGCVDTDLDPRMAKVLDIFSKFKEV